MRRLSLLVCLLSFAACGFPDIPTNPTPGQTRIIRLSGTLNFGGVGINQAPPDQVVTVHNDGTATLAVGGITVPCANTAITIVGVARFNVAAGGSVPVTFRFRPTTAASCSGTVTFTSDATDGTNTITQTASGVA